MNTETELFTTLLRGKGIPFCANEKLSAHCTFRIGGNADVFAAPSDTAELINVLEAVRESGCRYFILGRGSNILFDDAGYRGAVISTEKLTNVTFNGMTVTAECGVPLTKLAAMCGERGLSGLEFAYGIPGSVGGAVYMNAGAYGGEISQVITTSHYIDLDRRLYLRSLDREDHGYGYRESAFRQNNWLHVSSDFTLKEGDRDEIRRTMEDYMQRRRDKQPLEFPSAGSVFKRYPGHYTGQLIEEAGLKGYSIGGAEVSVKHAGFIINRGGATSADVLDLIAHIKRVIKEKYGFDIECEVIHIKADE